MGIIAVLQKLFIFCFSRKTFTQRYTHFFIFSTMAIIHLEECCTNYVKFVTTLKKYKIKVPIILGQLNVFFFLKCKAVYLEFQNYFLGFYIFLFKYLAQRHIHIAYDKNKLKKSYTVFKTRIDST